MGENQNYYMMDIIVKSWQNQKDTLFLVVDIVSSWYHISDVNINEIYFILIYSAKIEVINVTMCLDQAPMGQTYDYTVYTVHVHNSHFGQLQLSESSQDLQ